MVQSLQPIEHWFSRNGWAPFDFQRETWRAYLHGESGLVHAPTGMGKTYAVWLGPLAEYLSELQQSPAFGLPLRILWITPLRALANDTAENLQAALDGLNIPWKIELRTGDTSATIRKRQRTHLPPALITTPESLSVMLSYPGASNNFRELRCVIVDEWHELLGAKRGVQTELGLARLRTLSPQMRTWGLSATLGNLDQAMRVLLGAGPRVAAKRPGPPLPQGEGWGEGGAHNSVSMDRSEQNNLEDILHKPSSLDTCTLHPHPHPLPEGEGTFGRFAAGRTGPKPVLMQNGAGTLISGDLCKTTIVDTLKPDDVQRFPWSGHIGVKLLPQVIDAIESARTTLLFTNVRSQAEIWFQQLLKARPDLIGAIALHHGSLDRDIRTQVEDLLRDGRVKCVVCTSSLDLGADFSPVDQVLQLGSPKGIARLLQRAGRSGHQPGAASRIVGVPTNALELVEFAAAREAAGAQHTVALGKDGALPLAAQRPGPPLPQGEGWGEGESHNFKSVNETAENNLGHLLRNCPSMDSCKPHAHPNPLPEGEGIHGRFAADDSSTRTVDVESRAPLDRPLDVLVQHLVTIACGDGFVERDLLDEVRSTHAFSKLTDEEWRWCMEFVTQGGPALHAYPQYARIVEKDGRWVVASQPIERMHRLNIGTITSDAAVVVAMVGGSTLGTIEESFISRLNPGDRFVFAGRVLELVRLHNMTAQVRRSKHGSGMITRWNGSRCPLSTLLARAIRQKLDEARRGIYHSQEMQLVRPLLELQARWSVIPKPDELLIERCESRDGFHVFIYPFEGRQVHEGLSSLVAHRLASLTPRSMHVTANDYGLELLSHEPIELDEDEWRQVFTTQELVEDLLACLNTTALARRTFRDIARVAGLIIPGYPGQSKSTRQLQASSQMFFDVFTQFDPGNLLLEQSRREVLDRELEVKRVRETLERIANSRFVIIDTDRLTPLGFSLWADSIRTQHVSSEGWSRRIERMAMMLEREAEKDRGAKTKTSRHKANPEPVSQ